jgi:hypothetical protein
VLRWKREGMWLSRADDRGCPYRAAALCTTVQRPTSFSRPERTSDFLRSDQSFTAPPSGW